jgi:taurine dioxygenase
LLYGIEIPPVGGNTRFANMYSAYERLSERIKKKIDGRTALQMHEYLRTDRPSPKDDMSGIAHFSHPVAITHAETGRRALYVNRLMTARINGLDEAESDALIEELLGYAEDPALVYEHVWRPGDLVMWDNRCVTHARTDFPDTERRLLRRTTTEGARPYETMAEYENAR